MDRKKIMIQFGKLAGGICLCALVSRGIYAAALPRVETAYVKRMPIAHEVEAEGRIKQKEETAITVFQGMRVETVYAKKGETVQEGQQLLQIDEEDLALLIAEQEAEIKKLDLQINDLQINRQIARNKEQQEKQRAMEDYQLSLNQETAKINQAYSSVTETEGELDELASKGSYVDYYVNHDSQYRNYNNTMESLEKEIQDLESQINASVSQNEVVNKKALLEEKKKTLEELKKTTAAYKDGLAIQKGEDWETKRKALEDSVKSKKEAFTGVAEAGMDKVLNSGRTVQDSLLPENADSSMEIYQLERQQKQKKLKEYKKIYETNGQILAKQAGTIIQVAVSAGSRTTDGAALIVSSQEGGYEFISNISKEQKKYVEVGDKAQITLGEEGKKYDSLSIDSIEESEEGTYMVRVEMGAELSDTNGSGNLYTSRSTKTYEACVPLEALYADGEKTYVMVMDTKQTVLGDELAARRVDVTVEDKNDRYAAITKGNLTQEDMVIVKSTKLVKDGTVVRLPES